jgi:hypothetical protein
MWTNVFSLDTHIEEEKHSQHSRINCIKNISKSKNLYTSIKMYVIYTPCMEAIFYFSCCFHITLKWIRSKRLKNLLESENEIYRRQSKSYSIYMIVRVEFQSDRWSAST